MRRALAGVPAAAAGPGRMGATISSCPLLRQGLWKTACGLGLGLIGGYVLSRYLESLLFEVTTIDPIAYVAVCVGLLAVAVLASWLPARRAAKVDPIIALRAE